MIQTLAVSGYRSLRDLVLPLGQLNLVTGANGTGKSSLYRALRLLGDAALNTVVASLAREGGLPSTFWAGPEKIARSVRQGEHEVEGTPRQKSVSLNSGLRASHTAIASILVILRLRRRHSGSIRQSSANASGMAASIGGRLSWSIATIGWCRLRRARPVSTKSR